MNKFNICANCSPPHIDNCEECFGFGFYYGISGDLIPMSFRTRERIVKGELNRNVVNCSYCGSGIEGYLIILEK